MKHAWKCIILAMSISVAFSACYFSDCEKGSGEVITLTREVDSFNQILLNGNYDLFLSQDTVQNLSIEAEDNILTLLDTWVTANNELVVEFSECVRQHQTIKLYISMPQISSLKVVGSADVKAQTNIIANELQIEVNGSGDIELDTLAVNELQLDIKGSGNIEMDYLVATDVVSKVNGSGDINVAGEASSHIVEVQGSGDVEAYDLFVENYEISIVGSGDCRVHVLSNLDVHIKGSGTVYYQGEPEIVATVIDGSGEVIKIE